MKKSSKRKRKTDCGLQEALVSADSVGGDAVEVWEVGVEARTRGGGGGGRHEEKEKG